MTLRHRELGFPPDADGNGNYAFFDAANYAAHLGRDYAGVMLLAPNSWGLCRNYADALMPKISKTARAARWW